MDLRKFILDGLQETFPEITTRSGASLGRVADVRVNAGNTNVIASFPSGAELTLKPGELAVRVNFPKLNQRLTRMQLSVDGEKLVLTPHEQKGMADAMAVLTRHRERVVEELAGVEAIAVGPIRCTKDGGKNSLSFELKTKPVAPQPASGSAQRTTSKDKKTSRGAAEA